METKEQTTWDEFDKVDLRVGTIIQVDDFPKARIPAYKLLIDFGDFGTKRSSAQITSLYSREDLLNKQVIAVVNFPPRQVADFSSEVLVLGAVTSDVDIVMPFFDRSVPNGSQIA